MALSDFSTDGAPIPATSGVVDKTTVTTSPDWYTNYARDLLAGQGTISTTPYTPPPMPRVADFTGTERAGMAATTAASNYAAKPISTALDIAGGLSGMSGLSTAQPYLNAANRASYENVANYMNPYTDAVVNRIGELGGRTLREQLLPEISDRFVRAGQFGSSRQAEMIGRGLRDVYESTLAKQTEALQGGYSGALTASENDARRRAELARTAGGLGTDAVRSGLDVASALTDIGRTGQETALTGAGALTGVGTAERAMDQRNLDVALADWLKEQGYPQDQINTAINTLKGLKGAIPEATTEQGIQPIGAVQTYQPSGLATTTSGISGLLGILGQMYDLYNGGSGSTTTPTP